MSIFCLNIYNYFIPQEALFECLHYLFQFQLTNDKEKPPYPEWAQFIGAVIVLSSVLMIPIVLIVRLIRYESARKEGRDFILYQFQCAKKIVTSAKELATRVMTNKYVIA